MKCASPPLGGDAIYIIYEYLSKYLYKNEPSGKRRGWWAVLDKKNLVLTFLYCRSNLFVDFYGIIHYYILILCLLQKVAFLEKT